MVGVGYSMAYGILFSLCIWIFSAYMRVILVNGLCIVKGLNIPLLLLHHHLPMPLRDLSVPLYMTPSPNHTSRRNMGLFYFIVYSSSTIVKVSVVFKSNWKWTHFTRIQFQDYWNWNSLKTNVRTNVTQLILLMRMNSRTFSYPITSLWFTFFP